MSRQRCATVAGLALIVLTACTGSPPPPSAPVSTTVVPAISPVAGAGELQLPTLVADPSAPPGPWEEVLAVGFGPAPQKLGFERGNGPAPRGPTSFAVVGGATPSVWIADPVKHRFVHYSLADGAVLDAVHAPGHVPLGDLVATGGLDPAVWAVMDGPGGTIAHLSGQGLADEATIRDAGVRYEVDGLLADHSRLVAELHGGGASGFGRLRTADGRVARWEPGVPAVGAVSVDLGTGTSDDRLSIHWFHYQHQLATGAATIELRNAHGAPVPAVASARLEGTAPDGAIAWVQVSSARGGEGGDWILAVPPDPSAPMLFERLPGGGAPSGQIRALAIGLDGRLWLMVTGADGIHLFRR